MKRRTKLAIFVAICSIALGAMLWLAVMLGIDFDWMRLDTTPEYETVCVDLLTPFDSIEILQDSHDIKIIYTESQIPVLQYMESDKIKYSVENQDGVLTVRIEDSTRLWDRVGFHFGQKNDPATILYLPQKEYQRLHLTTASGDVTISNGGAVSVGQTTYMGPLSFSVADIKTVSGDISFDADLRTDSPMMLQTTSGDINVKCVSAGIVTLKSTSGAIAASDCTPQALFVDVNSGDIALRGIKTPQLYVESTSGDVACSAIGVETMEIGQGSGDVDLQSVSATQTLKVETVSGDVDAVSCYATEFRVESTSGDVELYFDDGINIIETETVSGDVQLEPKKQDNRGYGDCYVKTTSGDIYITRPPLPLWFN